ncbi:MAG: hypothetical protein IPJ20_19245 [Flammeovirgaceae bacterium]|nr:hypothetical protein [Flammeovirgaceae bacterium]
MGIFPQAGSSLVPDYLKLLDSDSIQDLEEFFQVRSSAEAKSNTNNFLQEIKEEKFIQPFRKMFGKKCF